MIIMIMSQKKIFFFIHIGNNVIKSICFIISRPRRRVNTKINI